MARFILIDNCSGYIWGDSADLAGKVWSGNDPVEYARALDESLGVYGQVYERCGLFTLASNETGYHVYRADARGSDAVVVVHDGQDWETVEAVERACEYVCTLRTTDPDLEAIEDEINGG